MPDILKREYAPISDAAWAEIDEQARRILLENLTARKVVDFSGPGGWEMAALNLGRLKLSKKAAPGEVEWGIREVLPLMETRTFFSLNMFEIDNLTRGSQDADIDALIKACQNAARFEDMAVFNGFNDAGIRGIMQETGHKTIKLPKEVDEYARAVSEAVKAMHLAGVGGPYTLVLGPDEYFNLAQAHKQGYPPRLVVKDIIEGEILLSQAIKGGVLMSTRGGDFELTVGQDFSVGYSSHSKENVEFFITESFTFRVLEPAACVQFTPPAVK